MPYIDIKISEMPEGFDDALRKKRDELILDGKIQFREMMKNYDSATADEQKDIRRILNQRKGMSSKKFHQYAKELFLTSLFERNNITINFKNLESLSMKIFGSHIDDSVLSKMKRHPQYGEGDKSPIDIVDEKETIYQLRHLFEKNVVPYRKEVLINLSIDAIYEDYLPK